PYMLDTNMASYVIRGEFKEVRQRLNTVPMASVCISAITEAELLHGLAKKPEAKRFAQIVHEFLLRVNIRSWTSAAAKSYAELRTACESQGKSLGNMDMLIAAHARAEGAILVSNDNAFYNINHLISLEDWTGSFSSIATVNHI
ncbi:MAG: type II toxin-antitoxin system VapC family toxin, partial [Cellvibrionaceae bacterium]|nr:type II toxin-antitoxin system VapC family toxin [Cellvibrionaceae bacterium]